MSLLIKALQKAEQGKTADGKTSVPDTALSLELTPIQNDAEPNLNDEAGVSRALPPSAKSQKNTSQQAAAKVFSAKERPGSQTGPNKIALLAGAGLLLFLVIGGGYYYYLSSLNPPELVVLKPVASVPETPAPVAITQAENDVPNNPAVASATEPSPPPAPPTMPARVEENVIATAPDLPVKATEVIPEAKPKASRPAQKPAAKSQRLVFGEPIEAGEDTTVKVTRNKPTPSINPDLLQAYNAFNAGDDASAQRLYRQVLQSDVRNIDALLGMAAIAVRQGRNGDANGWYGKVLEVEPKNSIANGAMASLLAQADPVSSESRIKSLLVQQPRAAHLYAALGNIYAEQNQWSSAQQAYFQAYQYDTDNTEYAFNLAVSLDQMGKSALALQYYKATLELLSKSGASGVDRAQLESRITQLQ